MIQGPQKRNQRITFQAPVETEDSYGGKTKTYVDTNITVWARMNTLRSDEALIAMQTTGKAIHNINIAYRSGIRADFRIKHGNKYYDIIGPPINVRFENRELDIKVEEIS